MSEESAYNTSKADSGELVDSLIGGTALNYIGNRSCVCRESLAARREKMHVKLGDLDRKEELEETRIGTASIGQRGMWHGLAPYRITLMAQNCLGRNSRIIFASDMG